MSLLRSCFFATPIGVLVIACSGSAVTVDGTNSDASSSDGAANVDGGGGGGDGASGDATGGGDASSGDASTTNDAGAADSASMPDSSTAACPDEHGKYSIVATGLGCGDLSFNAPQCITQSMCTITFVSNGGNAKGLNGDANIGNDGSFTGAAIKEGSVSRTGCVGTWDAVTSRLTVDCGGTSTSQSCRATLTRTAMMCN